MAWRYRDRDSKIFVSSATYNRSRGHGGTRFERVSDAKWTRNATPAQPRAEKKTVEVRTGSSGISTAKKGRESVPSASRIKTLRDYMKYYQYYDLYEPEFEVETGVDY